MADAIRKAEQIKLSIIGVSVVLFLISLSRILTEKLLLSPSGTISISVSEGCYLVGLHFSAYLAVTLSLSLLSGENPRRTARFALFIFPAILLGPIVDHFLLSPPPLEYEWGPLTPVTPGLAVQTLVIAFLCFLYVKTKVSDQRGLRASLLRGTIGTLLAVGLLVVVSLPIVQLSFSLAFESGVIHPESLNMFCFLYYFLLSMVLVMLNVGFFNPKLLLSFISNMRLLRTIHFLLMVTIGILVSEKLLLPFISSGAGGIENYINDLPYVLTCWLGAALGWQVTVMTNDIYDVDIDKFTARERVLVSGLMTKEQFKRIVLLITIFGIGMSTLLGSIPFIFFMLAGFLAWAYSAPPLRLRNSIFGSLIIGLGSVVVYLIGYFATNYVYIVDLLPGSHEFLFPLTPGIEMSEKGGYVAIIILSALSISPIITQLKDYEGDLRAGVRSIYTVMGRERGKAVAAVLIPLLFMIPTLLFHHPLDLALALSSGLFSSAYFWKREDYKPILILYMFLLIYFIARLQSLFLP